MTVPLCPYCFQELSDLRDKEDRIDYFCDCCNESLDKNEVITDMKEELSRIKDQVKTVIDFVSDNNFMQFHSIAKDLMKRFL